MAPAQIRPALSIGTTSVDALRFALAAHDDGRRVALAVLLEASVGGPRSPGAISAFDSGGLSCGTLSAGCVDGDVATVAREVMASGRLSELRFASGADAAFGAPSCGADVTIRVLTLDDGMARDVRRFVDAIDGGATRRELALPDAVGVPALAYERRWRLRVYGATVFAPALAAVAAAAGFAVTIVDPRPHLLVPLRERFACVEAWPHDHHDAQPPGPRDAIVVTAHDPKFELPLLERALRSDAGYVGALGSRRTVEARRTELLARGLRGDDVDRLHSPIGLDLGGREPEETAVAILAEIIAVGNRADGASLSRTDRPIHRTTADSR